MSTTNKASAVTNIKQPTGGDYPVNPSLPVTYMYGPVLSTASQTVINLGFSVDQSNKNNFVLVIAGIECTEGSTNDYQFTQIANGYSSQVTMNYGLTVGVNIKARYWGIAQSAPSSTSVSSLQAQINTATSQSLKNF